MINRIKHLQTEFLVTIFLALAIFSVFGQVLNHEFIAEYDDLDYILKNSHVQAGLTWDSITWAFSAHLHGQWHPLTWLSHMTDVHLFGLDPALHHLTSMILHLVNSLLLFFLLARSTRSPIRSALVALLFALHPIHVEPVAMVSYRKDLLCALFMLLSMHYYLSFARKGGTFNYLLVLIFFIMGLMSKAVIVVLPFLLLLFDHWPLHRLYNQRPFSQNPCVQTDHIDAIFIKKSFFQLVLEKILLLVPMLVVAVIVIIVRNPTKSLFRLPTLHHVENAVVSYLLYIGKTLWPTQLSVIYPRPELFSLWQVVSAGLFLLIVTLLVIQGRKKHPYLLIGWGWFLVGLLPVIGLLGFMAPHTMADRYMYIPIVGLFIMLVWGISKLFEKHRLEQKLGVPTSILVTLLLMFLSWMQTGYWKNSIFLFTHATRVTEANYKAHSNLGLALIKKGDISKAEKQFFQALRINPSFSPAHGNLGGLYDHLGKLSQAEFHYSEALRLSPNIPGGHTHLGLIMGKQGNLDMAIQHFEKAIISKPNDAFAYYNLGNALMLKGLLNEAITRFTEAIEKNPQYAESYNAKGYALTLAGKPDKGMKCFNEALRINPGYNEAQDNLDHSLELLSR